MELTQILPQFGGVAFTLVAFVVALSIIVAVHEYGHYIVGRWTGIHAEVFSLGFGPVLFARTDRHGTRWQVAALPFGGYVKFLGDANAASVGSTEVAAAERRRTMLGAPLWARAATVAAGPVFNFVLAIVIFAGLILWQGRPSDPVTIAAVTAMPDRFASDLQPGDRILAVAGRDVPAPEGFTVDFGEVPLTERVTYTVERDGQRMDIDGPYPFAPIVGGVNPDSAALDVGIAPGDVILTLNGAPVFAFEQLVESVMNSDGRPQTYGIWRDGEELTFVVVPRRVDQPTEDGFITRWLVGIAPGALIELQTETPGLWEALVSAVDRFWFVITSSLSGIVHLVSGAISTCAISGPVGIAQASGAMAAQGSGSFIAFVAILSAAVGLMNLFPIPILDGGHLVFHAYEAVARKPPSDRALRVLMATGLSLILTLMAFAILNDLWLCP